jgi:hypothetical protein
MSDRKTLPTSPRSISSPVSADGPTLFDWLAGPTIEQSGPAPVRARRSRAQAKKSDALSAAARVYSRILTERASLSASAAITNGTPTAGTCGPKCDGSSRSVVLQNSLESRLRAATDLSGSPEYALRWKNWDMALGPPIIALRASARRKSDNAFTGWPTPSANEMCTQDEAQLVKRREECKARTGNGNGFGLTLGNTAMLAGWPTPKAQEDFAPDLVKTAARQARARVKYDNGEYGSNSGPPSMNSLSVVAMLTGWNTPRATDGSKGGPNQTGGALPADAALTGWATPSSRDFKDTPGMATTGTNPDGSERQRLDQLPRQAALVSGTTPESSTAETKSTGAYLLNPRFSLWLQGLPAAWASCGERAIASLPSKRRGSSKRRKKQ